MSFAKPREDNLNTSKEEATVTKVGRARVGTADEVMGRMRSVTVTSSRSVQQALCASSSSTPAVQDVPAAASIKKVASHPVPIKEEKKEEKVKQEKVKQEKGDPEEKREPAAEVPSKPTAKGKAKAKAKSDKGEELSAESSDFMHHVVMMVTIILIQCDSGGDGNEKICYMMMDMMAMIA